jgi:putative multiple sugar transport system ATP-binding protein
MSDHILEMKNIVKEFSGVRALDNVNLSIERGEIHALCGENGAGKSTLMNVLSGLYPYGSYDGEIIYDGETCKFKDLRDSENKGIVIIHQELALSPYLSIKENIFLGNEQAKHGIIDWDMTEKKTDNLLKTVGLKIDPNTLVSQIGVGHQQLVEIAKAFSKSVRLLILDEPTAALNEEESANLLELIKEFKVQGITSIIISHKLNEIVTVADRITILRDGQTIETLENEDINEERIIKGMVGRDLTNRYPERQPQIGEVYFEVKDWTVHHPIDGSRTMNNNIHVSIRRGEIIGIAGLMGAGRTEFAMSVFGHSYGSNISGKVYKEGREISVKDVPTAIQNGLAYVSEDRKALGLNLLMDICENTTIASLGKISRTGVIDKEREVLAAEEYRKKMRTKTSSVFQNVGSLSGGNQQKVVLAKWLMTEPDILFLDEPTRGIDVGAKYEIYTIIEEMAASGKSICIISSELPEILGMCDRIYTMNEGRITGEVMRADANQEVLMNLMTMEEEGVSEHGTYR